MVDKDDDVGVEGEKEQEEGKTVGVELQPMGKKDYRFRCR